MDKLIRRDIKKEKPTGFQICLIFPHWVKAEYQEGRFYSTDGRVSYMGIKTWVPVSEIRNLLTDKEY